MQHTIYREGAMAGPVISKSKFLWGMQCSRLFWFAFNQRDSIPPPEPELLDLFSRGHGVGRRARSMFPGGIEIAPDTYDVYRVAQASALALAARRPLFEAGFIHQGTFARADILVPFGHRGWDLIEVKASTGVHDVHLEDLALQRHVYEGAGLLIRRCFIMHCAAGMDPETEPDVRRSFVLADVTARVSERQRSTPERLTALRDVIGQTAAPEIPTGPHCHAPYDCPLLTVCTPRQHGNALLSSHAPDGARITR